ncbi:hypothetical protein CEXT_348291 [Caerostris extrusa]|uniref:Uncharacterized protein n=1 Tax=Caerostris extrusa TaxID=172846 RepID=A0AAV4US35_CAEEX|nr:hypothetical protein CEXT_348291 [Caerostris extrusa]
MGLFIETERDNIYERIPHRSATKLVCREQNTAEDVACLGFLENGRRNISYFLLVFSNSGASVFVLRHFRVSETAGRSSELIHMESLLQMLKMSGIFFFFISLRYNSLNLKKDLWGICLREKKEEEILEHL